MSACFSASSFFKSSRDFTTGASLAAVLVVFVVAILCLLSLYKLRLDWQLVSCKAHCFASNIFLNAFHFEQYSTAFDFRDEELWITFTTTHFHILRFACSWNMGENANPDLTTTLDITSHCLTS